MIVTDRWPEGPLESPFQYDLRDLRNARADMGDAIRQALTPILDRLADTLGGILSR